ncbi:MAG: TIGR01548 family HAD-type hydrolase [Halodesulfurarchaeum sp.]
MQVDTVVLDIDGVLVDVSNSYRRAVVGSVAVVYGETIPRSQVQRFKDAGGFNNDWVLTDAIAMFVLAREAGLRLEVSGFTEAVAARGGGRDGAEAVIRERLPEGDAATVLERWDPDRLRTVFQQLYLGPEGYRELEDADPDLYADGSESVNGVSLPPEGYIADEPVLLESETAAALEATFELGVVTGRPRAEAHLALDRVGLSIPADRLYAMEDGPGKPDPAALRSVAEAADAAAVAFAGDTRDDVRTARNAEKSDPDRSYHGIGVLTGGLSGPAGRQAFESVGAAAVIETINELPAILEPR